MIPDFSEFLSELGLNPHVQHTVDSIKKAYRQLAMEFHPDRNPDGVERFKRICYAFKMLTDPNFHNTEQGFQAPPRDVHLNMDINFNQAFFGGEFRMYVSLTPVSFDKMIEANEKREYTTDAQVDILNIKIRPGSFNGNPLVIQNDGLKRKGLSGRVLIMWRVAPHPIFSYQDGNVISKVKIPLHSMLTGDEMEIPTMYGIKILKIHPGTRPGDEIKIKGCGLNGQHNHVAVVEPLYPDESELRGDKWDKNFKIKWEKKEEKDFFQAMDETYIQVGGQSFRWGGGSGGGGFSTFTQTTTGL